MNKYQKMTRKEYWELNDTERKAETPDQNSMRQKDRYYLNDLKEEIENLNLKDIVTILQTNNVPMLQKLTVYTFMLAVDNFTKIRK